VPTFAAPDLQRLTEEVFHAVGFPRSEAQTIADIMVRANLAGHDSHGVIHIPGYVGRVRSGQIRPGAPVEIVHETPTTAILNGNFTMGHVAATKAMQVATAKAKQCAIAAVGVHNLNHVGRVGTYPLMAAEQGLGAIVTANSGGASKLVTPFWGRQARFGTNPIAMCFPNPAGVPLLLDMATSASAAGKIRVALNRGEPTGEGWILNKDGVPTRDPTDFYAGGMQLPLGADQGHKGYCLAVMVEVLSGILARTGTAARERPDLNNGTFMIVIDITAFVPLEQFHAELAELVDYLHATPVAPGKERVLVPGEYEAKRRREGIPVEAETWRQIQKTVQELGLEAHLPQALT
jgi:LDH2 family malate/lactate/ureidoglycolate dehydrogenase